MVALKANMPDLTPQEFARRWSGVTLSERSASQQHFVDLCHMLNQKTPAEADPTGEFYTFERRVQKTGINASGGKAGSKGFADVWYKGHFAWEYKGPHKDLDAAYNQLLLYREDLDNPPLLVVSDMNRYEIHTNFTGTAKKVYSFTNAELPQAENLRVLRALFEDPESLRPAHTSEGVTEEAARKFARLAEGLRSRGHDPHRAAHFLNKLLFCLFAEDVGLLPKGLFTRVVERTGRDPERFANYVKELFGAMASGGDFLLEDIRHFNGGLFSDDEAHPSEVAVEAPAARTGLPVGPVGELAQHPARVLRFVYPLEEPILLELLRGEVAQVLIEPVRHEPPDYALLPPRFAPHLL